MKVNFRYEGVYESEYKQRISELVEYILNLQYGDTISFEKAGYILKYNLENEKELRKFRSTMARVKNILVDYGYVLKTIANVGYYILKPKQISGYCYHTYIKRTENLLAKSDRILSHTKTSELSEERMKEYGEVCGLNSNLTYSIQHTIRDSAYYHNKNHYDSLED